MSREIGNAGIQIEPMTNDVIPISDEQAKAIQEALKALQGVGGFLKKTFGTLPQDIVGLLGGDYLKVRRARKPLSNN
jgi:hypothetical protein